MVSEFMKLGFGKRHEGVKGFVILEGKIEEMETEK